MKLIENCFYRIEVYIIARNLHAEIFCEINLDYLPFPSTRQTGFSPFV